MIAFLLYNLLQLILLPLITLYFLWRIFVSGKSKNAWREQLGRLPKSLRRVSDKPRVWLHAVSVGEAVASGSVMSEIRKALPEAEIVMSTTTETGQGVARKSVKADEFFYYPLDLLFAVRSSIDKVKPDVFVSMETEIWPNFLKILGLRKIPGVIVNGVISDRTVRRSRRLRWMYKPALANVRAFCMQSEDDKKRIISLGAEPDRVKVCGNTKFDQSVPSLAEEERVALAKSCGFSPDDVVFIAGSTNPGEEEPVLEAFGIAREKHPGLKLIIAPRQVERGAEIAELCAEEGYTSGQRSIAGDLDDGKDVAILDTLGELATVYALGAVAFVGGTFIPKGGHNILQPIAQGKPVFYGHYTFKTRDLVRIAEAGGVGFAVQDGRELGERISSLLSNPAELETLNRRAVELMDANRGASARCANVIAELVKAQ